MIKYDIKNLEAEQRGRGYGRDTTDWTLIITVHVHDQDKLGAILTDVERRLGAAGGE